MTGSPDAVDSEKMPSDQRVQSWDLIHMFYANMGGFVLLYKADEGRDDSGQTTGYHITVGRDEAVDSNAEICAAHAGSEIKSVPIDTPSSTQVNGKHDVESISIVDSAQQRSS